MSARRRWEIAWNEPQSPLNMSISLIQSVLQSVPVCIRWSKCILLKRWWRGVTQILYNMENSKRCSIYLAVINWGYQESFARSTLLRATAVSVTQSKWNVQRCDSAVHVINLEINVQQHSNRVETPKNQWSCCRIVFLVAVLSKSGLCLRCRWIVKQRTVRTAGKASVQVARANSLSNNQAHKTLLYVNVGL